MDSQIATVYINGIATQTDKDWVDYKWILENSGGQTVPPKRVSYIWEAQNIRIKGSVEPDSVGIVLVDGMRFETET